MNPEDSITENIDVEKIAGFRLTYRKVEEEIKRLKLKVKSMQEQLINAKIHSDHAKHRLDRAVTKEGE